MGDVTTYDAGGVLLACESRGPADGPPLLFLHALGEDRGSWRRVAAALAADGWHTLAPDLRGHGDSGRPGAYTYESMRDDVLALLDLLGIDEVTLVAHSMGTAVASLIAMDRPHAVRRMVLEEGPLPFPARPPRPVPAAPEGPTPYDWRVVPAIALQRNDPPARHLRGLAEITAPTLIVAGGPDSHLPQEELAEVAARIPGARMVTLGGGHMVHDEEPELFTAAVRDFLGPPPAADREPLPPFVPFALTAGQLRRAVPELAAFLASAGAGPAAGNRPAGPVPAPDDAAGWWQARTKALAGRAVEVLAVRDGGGAVCGTVEWRRAGPPGSVTGGGHRGEIGALLVRADVRRRGLGRLLLRTAEAAAWADGVRLLLLDTWAGGATECLCRAEGWTPLGAVPGHAPGHAGTARPVTFVKTLDERPR